MQSFYLSVRFQLFEGMIKNSLSVAPPVAFSYVLIDVAKLNAVESFEERLR